jgi:transposase
MFVRARRQLAQSMRERARRADADRITQARQQERQRIAREMHDVLAHRISLLSLHAGALELRADGPADEIARAAGVIRDSAHQALEDLREALHACFPSIRMLWADSGYTGTLVEWAAAQLSLTVQIVAKLAGQTTFVVLHRRWCVERTFSWINRCRRTVRDYERLPQHHAAMVQWAMVIIMTRRLARHGLD